MSTPKFKQIVSAGTGYGGGNGEGHVELFGLTESGDVYAWDGRNWYRLKNRDDNG